MDIDTEDRVDRYKLALCCVSELVGNATPCAVITPGPLACLLHVLQDELERALPTGGGRPPRAVNDLDGA